MRQRNQLDRSSLLNISQRNIIFYNKSKGYCVNFERNFTFCGFGAFFSVCEIATVKIL